MAQDASVLASILARRLKKAGLTICTAESCTGGMLASALTDIQGASKWYSQGWVTYSNEAKQQQLQVPIHLFIAEEGAAGAVSAEVAEAMADGAIEESGANMAIAVTGIAGPTGATETKEIGLVWIGIHLNGETFSKSAEFGHGDRHSNKEAFTTFALREALKVWEENILPEEPEPEEQDEEADGEEAESPNDGEESEGESSPHAGESEEEGEHAPPEGQDEDWQEDVAWSEEQEVEEPVIPDSEITWGEE